MRVAVTGACGFIGRHLVRKLASRGPVRCLDATLPSPEPPPWGLGGIDDFRVVDVTDHRTLSGALDGCRAVVHLAAMSHPRLCRDRPVDAFRVNALGTVHLLDAAERAGAERVIVVSSRYAGEAPPGGDVYATTKAIAEAWTRVRRQIVLRLDNVYGPGQEEGAVVADFVGRALRGAPIGPGSPEERVPLLFVHDAVDAMARLVVHGVSGAVYHAKAAEWVPLAGVAALLTALVGQRTPPALPRGEERAPDPSLEAVGWRASTPWPTGVRTTFAHAASRAALARTT